jgi:Flp pilus assembly protein TadD/outer membrane protein OmpA-like peptidoglycan-associated protein
MRKGYQIVLGLMLMLLLIPNVSKAQVVTLDDNDNVKYHWYVNLNGGLTQSYCDIQNSIWPWGMLGKDQHGIAYGLKIGRHINSTFSVYLQGKMGDLKGVSGVDSKHLRFNTDIKYDLSLGTTISLSNLIFGYKPRLLNLYMPLDFGFSKFKATTHVNDRNLARDVELAELNRRYGEGNVKQGETSGMYFANGLGLGIRLTERLSINLETKIQWMMEDNFDGIIAGQGSSAESNAADKLYDSWKDAFYYQNVGLSYNFGKSKNDVSFKLETGYEVLALVGDSVPVLIEGNIPENFNSKAVVDFTPVMKYGDQTVQLKTIYLQGEEVADEFKKPGAIVLPETGGKFTYTAMVPYQPGMEQAEVFVEPMASIKGKTPKSLSNRATNDGMILTATRFRHDENFLPVEVKLDRTRKIESMKETVWFVVDRTNKNMSYRLNRRAEAKDQIKAFEDFLGKKMEIKDISISAWASPEGEETHNVGLSEGRVATGKAFLFKQLKKLDIDPESLSISEHPLAEDWDGFVAAIKNSNISDKNKILNIVNSQSDLAAREQEIRNMTVIYREIAEDILPELRRVEISATCFADEGFKTDTEIKDLAANNPTSLTVNELLYAAQIINNDNSKLAIYKGILKNNPECWRAANNAGVIAAKLGNTKEATSYIQKAKSLKADNPSVLNNAAVIAAFQGDFSNARSGYLAAQSAGSNVNHNMGIVKIKEGNYNGAVTSFSSDNCNYNKGLAQLLAKNYSAAKSTLDCADKAADTYYLKAILGARTNDIVYLTSNLKKAIELDSKYIEEAKSDREFKDFVTNPDFLNIVK